MKRKTTRRDFLRGQITAPTPADSEPPVKPAAARKGLSSRGTSQSYLLHITRQAMACEFQVFLNAGQYEHATEAALEALDLVERLEQQLSVFRHDSEISRINREAAERPVPVETRLFGLLQLAATVHGETQGAFDLTAGPLWEAWGFARRAGSVPTAAELAEVMARVDGRLVELDPEQETVHFPRPGLSLNLGSIGKGHAVDRCAEELDAAGIGDCLLHGGQSSILAKGSRLDGPQESKEGPVGGWTVGIRHPLRHDRRLAEVRLHDRALGTSGSGVQFFRHRGRRLGHILDPRTGQPAEGVLSTTVLAPTAALADALATAFYVMGVDATLEYCQARPGIAVVFVCPARRAGGMEIVSAGLADDEWRLVEAP